MVCGGDGKSCGTRVGTLLLFTKERGFRKRRIWRVVIHGSFVEMR